MSFLHLPPPLLIYQTLLESRWDWHGLRERWQAIRHPLLSSFSPQVDERKITFSDVQERQVFMVTNGLAPCLYWLEQPFCHRCEFQSMSGDTSINPIGSSVMRCSQTINYFLFLHSALPLFSTLEVNNIRLLHHIYLTTFQIGIFVNKCTCSAETISFIRFAAFPFKWF